MKSIFILFFLMCMNISNSQNGSAKDDNAAGTSMWPIYNKAKTYIKLVEEKKLEIVRMEYDIVTMTKKNSWRKLVKDIKYSVIVFGDYRIKDIDVSIFKYRDKKWVRIVKDKKEASFAIVSFIPDKTEEYKIEISVYQFKDKSKAAHYGLFVAR